MQNYNSGSVVRKRILRLKKRKRTLRRQQSLREKILLAKQQSQGLLIRETVSSFDA